MKKIKNIYNSLSETNKTITAIIGFLAIAVVNFFVLKFIIEEHSRQVDPENPRAHMEKVLREFI